MAIWPATVEQLRQILSETFQKGIPVTVLGGCSNVLISDRGIRGLTVFLTHLTRFHIRGSLFCPEPGLSLEKAINIAIDNGLGGIESLGGIPGTIGGAIAGNAGPKGLSIGEFITFIDYLEPDGSLHRFIPESTSFSYRHSPFSETDLIITEAGLSLSPTAHTWEARQHKETAKRNRRASGQFDQPSAGSFFKNPSPTLSAGKLIDNCSLKGASVGGAMVSRTHANFIVNVNNRASSTDIYELARFVQHSVLEQTGIRLEPEVKFIGDWEHSL